MTVTSGGPAAAADDAWGGRTRSMTPETLALVPQLHEPSLHMEAMTSETVGGQPSCRSRSVLRVVGRMAGLCPCHDDAKVTVKLLHLFQSREARKHPAGRSMLRRS